MKTVKVKNIKDQKITDRELQSKIVKNIPRINSLVKVKFIENEDLLMMENDTLIFMGQVPNMIGHCLILNLTTNTFIINQHTSSFEELSVEQL